MSITFLRLQLAHADGSDRPADVVLVNVASIARIHPTWPKGCTIVMNDASLHTSATFDEITMRLIHTGGDVMVRTLP